MSTLKKLLKEYRYYTILIPILIFLFRVWALPPRVDAVEDKTERNEDAVQKLANIVEKNVAVHDERMESMRQIIQQNAETNKMLTKLHIQNGIKDE